MFSASGSWRSQLISGAGSKDHGTRQRRGRERFGPRASNGEEAGPGPDLQQKLASSSRRICLMSFPTAFSINKGRTISSAVEHLIPAIGTSRRSSVQIGHGSNPSGLAVSFFYQLFCCNYLFTNPAHHCVMHQHDILLLLTQAIIYNATNLYILTFCEILFQRQIKSASFKKRITRIHDRCIFYTITSELKGRPDPTTRTNKRRL